MTKLSDQSITKIFNWPVLTTLRSIDRGGLVKTGDGFNRPTLIYPLGIYSYKEQGYDCQQVSAVQGF